MYNKHIGNDVTKIFRHHPMNLGLLPEPRGSCLAVRTKPLPPLVSVRPFEAIQTSANHLVLSPMPASESSTGEFIQFSEEVTKWPMNIRFGRLGLM